MPMSNWGQFDVGTDEKRGLLTDAAGSPAPSQRLRSSDIGSGPGPFCGARLWMKAEPDSTFRYHSYYVSVFMPVVRKHLRLGHEGRT
jgi:hypothetical protein